MTIWRILLLPFTRHLWIKDRDSRLSTLNNWEMPVLSYFFFFIQMWKCFTFLFHRLLLFLLLLYFGFVIHIIPSLFKSNQSLKVAHPPPATASSILLLLLVWFQGNLLADLHEISTKPRPSFLIRCIGTEPSGWNGDWNGQFTGYMATASMQHFTYSTTIQRAVDLLNEWCMRGERRYFLQLTSNGKTTGSRKFEPMTS